MNGTDWNEKDPAGDTAEREMQEFEAALLRAMLRVDAPDGFSARVVALAEAERRTKLAAQPERKPWWRRGGLPGWKPVWGAMAAVLVAGVLGGHAVHERHAEQERVQASRQFDVSLQITDRALEHAREQLMRKGVALDGQ